MNTELSLAKATGDLGEWMLASHAKGPAPHIEPFETHARLDVIWADKERTIPVAVRDYDGCEALVRSFHAG